MIDQVTLTVVERMERKVMQESVRHDDEVLFDQQVPNRRKQFLPQSPQISIRCMLDKTLELVQILGAQHVLGELKLQCSVELLNVCSSKSVVLANTGSRKAMRPASP